MSDKTKCVKNAGEAKNPVDETKCIGCGACASICPVGAIKVVDGKAKLDKNKCKKCHACQNFCPMEAIEIPED